jgi:hypothetical protein
VNRIIRCLAIAVIAVVTVPIASADEPTPTKEQLDAAKAAFNESNALYKAGKLVEAIAKLEESYRLSRNAILLANIARIYDKIGQKDKVLFYYRKFLKEAPENAPLRDQATKRVGELEQEIVVETPVEPDPEPTPVKLVGKYSKDDFKHHVIDSVQPNKTVDVIAFVPEDSGFTVTLFYRGTGDETFVAEPMSWEDKVLVGRIPAAKVVGNWIQYYVEVRDREANLVTRAGKATSPNLVNVEQPVTVVTTRPPDDPLLAQPEKPREPLRPGKWIATVGAVGLIGGAVVFYARAKQQHDLIEVDAASCGTPPCRDFDAGYAQGVESRGILYDRLFKVSLVVGVGVGVLSGYLWYRDLDRKKTPTDVSVAITPAFGDGYVGAAMAARF